MPYIALIAVLAIILMQWSGVVPLHSVGGPMTLAIVFLAAAMAVGIHDAWINRRGVIGWVVSAVTALVGAIIAGLFGGTLMDFVMPLVASLFDLQGSLAQSRHPLLYVVSAVMMLIVLFGSRLALRFVSRWR